VWVARRHLRAARRNLPSSVEAAKSNQHYKGNNDKEMRDILLISYKLRLQGKISNTQSNPCVTEYRTHYTTHLKFKSLAALTLVQTEKKIINLVAAISFNIALNKRAPWTRLHDENNKSFIDTTNF
jgi:hypothetical protein